MLLIGSALNSGGLHIDRGSTMTAGPAIITELSKRAKAALLAAGFLLTRLVRSLRQPARAGVRA